MTFTNTDTPPPNNHPMTDSRKRADSRTLSSRSVLEIPEVSRWVGSGDLTTDRTSVLPAAGLPLEGVVTHVRGRRLLDTNTRDVEKKEAAHVNPNPRQRLAAA